MRLLRRTLPACLAVAALSGPALADPAMWRVSDADSEIYLFGSVHVFSRDVADWRSAEFDALIASAEHVYFEVVLDIEAYSTITQITIAKGRIANGERLSDLLAPDDYDKVAAAAVRVGTDMALLDRMQPWLAAMTLVTAAMPKTSAGVEMLVDAEIAPERKRSLETAEQQMGILADAPLNEQIDGLVSAADGIDSGMLVSLEPIISAWEQGDTAALLSVMTAQMTPRDRASYDRLITERNLRWLTPIEQLLADNDESLLIVGAGHLVGPEGVPALLAQRGYTVERVDDPPVGGPAAAAGQGAAIKQRR